MKKDHQEKQYVRKVEEGDQTKDTRTYKAKKSYNDMPDKSSYLKKQPSDKPETSKAFEKYTSDPKQEKKVLNSNNRFQNMDDSD